MFEAILTGAHREKRVAILGSEGCSYAELGSRVNAAADRLAELGADAGHAVGIALPHSRAYIVALLAVRRLGAILVPMNFKAPAVERNRILADAGCRFLLAEEETSASMHPVESLDRCHCRVLEPTQARNYPPGSAIVIYTSGSTGAPKGAVLSENALSANIRAVADYLALSPGDRMVVFTPPSFAYAVNQILTHLWVGGAVLPWWGGLLNPLALLEAHASVGATGIQANPSILQVLSEIDKSLQLPSIRYVMSGGQPLTSSLARELGRLCPNARIVNMYGCTENAPRVSFKWLPLM